ncbi:hypothetical protein KBC25_01740 [Candidatus Pacearchaeota archaeon]|jgi:hypothetical protein|nr:hypothetical protein [Candidatus Pacearchaeota archaeon]
MGIDIFYNLDAELIIFGLLFVLFFAIIRLALSKTIKDKGPLGVISLSIALLSVYGLSKTNLDFPGFFYKIGINNNLLYSVIPIIILVGTLYMFWKVTARVIFSFFGVLFIIVSFFLQNAVWLFRIIGIIFLIIGIVLIRREAKRRVNQRIYLRR